MRRKFHIDYLNYGYGMPHVAVFMHTPLHQDPYYILSISRGIVNLCAKSMFKYKTEEYTFRYDMHPSRT